MNTLNTARRAARNPLRSAPMIRIANGQGFWGDWLEAPVRLVEQGPHRLPDARLPGRESRCRFCRSSSRPTRISATRAIFRRLSPASRNRSVNAEYGDRQRRRRESDRLRARGAAARARTARWRSCSATTCSDRLDEFLMQLATRCATWIPANRSPPSALRVQSANAYIGAFPLAEALATGADVVITGRCTDTALALAPMIHAFGWTSRRLRTCSPPALSPDTSSNAARNAPAAIARWTGRPFPIWRISVIRSSKPIPTATLVITKHQNTGGRVTSATVKEQLLYEIGDPQQLHHSRCRRRFHQHPASRRTGRTACASPGLRAGRARIR